MMQTTSDSPRLVSTQQLGTWQQQMMQQLKQDWLAAAAATSGSSGRHRLVSTQQLGTWQESQRGAADAEFELQQQFHAYDCADGQQRQSQAGQHTAAGHLAAAEDTAADA
jgi:hypothetical protein